MFQTEINHLLQGLASPWLDAFMKGVSWTGDQTFIVGLLCLVALGIDLRRGFLLVQIFLITIISTDILKTVFALPRPFFVDGSLEDYGALKDGVVALVAGEAENFLAWLPDASIEAYRLLDLKAEDYGLPSGHTTGAVALWGGLAIVFRKNWLGFIALIMIPLMMISRLYLARHFVADVAAGLALGSFVLLMAALFINRFDWRRLFIALREKGQGSGSWFLLGVGLILPIALLFTGQGHVGRIGAFLAVNTALIVLIIAGISFDAGRFWHRVLRTVLGFGMFFLLTYAVKLLPLPAGTLTTSVIKGFAPVFILFVSAPLLVEFLMRRGSKTVAG